MPTVERDGVKLHYLDRGSGPLSFLFVHGWCCDHTFFAPQIAHFGRRNRVVSVDLRGHGASDKPVQAYTMEGFADDLAGLSEQIGLDRPIVVGHSMGGIIAVALGAQRPDLPAALVTLDAPIAQPPAFAEAIAPVRDALRGPNFREVTRGIVAGMFLPTDDADRKARIVESLASAPQHVMVSFLEESVRFDSFAAATTCRMPILNVWSAGGFPDLSRYRAACPQLVHAQTAGSGHFHQLEVPDQINAMIERFLTISGLSS